MQNERATADSPPDAPEDLTIAELVGEDEKLGADDAEIRYTSRVEYKEPTFKDDFFLAEPLDDDLSEYEKLRPPEGLSPAQRRAITANDIPLTIEEEPDRPLTQFTLQEGFWLTTFLSVAFAVMYYLPPHQVAGVLGLLAIIGQVLLFRFPPENRHVRLGALLMLVLYAIASVVAFVMHMLSE